MADQTDITYLNIKANEIPIEEAGRHIGITRPRRFFAPRCSGPRGSRNYRFGARCREGIAVAAVIQSANRLAQEIHRRRLHAPDLHPEHPFVCAVASLDTSAYTRSQSVNLNGEDAAELLAVAGVDMEAILSVADAECVFGFDFSSSWRSSTGKHRRPYQLLTTTAQSEHFQRVEYVENDELTAILNGERRRVTQALVDRGKQLNPTKHNAPLCRAVNGRVMSAEQNEAAQAYGSLHSRFDLQL